MTRFNLMLADSDEHYIDSLGKYISSNYGNRFNVSIYTHQDAFRKLLGESLSKTDIMLLTSEFLFEEILNADAGTKIILTPSKQEKNINDFPCIFKYQPADKIVGDLISICSGMDLGADFLVKGSKKTRMVAVLSPQGGSGKTTIATGLSYQLGRLGARVFYLNIEPISSASFLMNLPENKCDMNEVLYHIKQNAKNMPVIIEKAIQHDKRLNVDYFASTGCSLELDELNEKDMSRLLSEIKGLGKYDAVVVDMQTGFNRFSIPVLLSSDALVIVTAPDITLSSKLSVFNKEMERIAAGTDWKEDCVIIHATNQISGHGSPEDFQFSQGYCDVRIPYLKDIYELREGTPVYNTESRINVYMKHMAQCLAEKLSLEPEGR